MVARKTSSQNSIQSPFGMVMPGRNWQAATASGYGFGFGGQESDNEVYGNRNMVTADYWQYDVRLGRRWNIDPIYKPMISGYVTFDNNPIYFNDPLGLGPEETTKHKVESGDTYGKLAKKYNVTVDQLREWNKYDDKSIPIGVNLIVSDPKAIKNDATDLNFQSFQSLDVTEQVELVFEVLQNSGVNNILISSSKITLPTTDNKYSYKEQTNLSSAELYTNILYDNVRNQFGDGEEAFAVTSILLGQPIIGKRFVTMGSSGGTSIASATLRKLAIESPIRIPTIVGGMTTGFRISYTTSVGAAAARWLPYVGWTILAYDLVKVLSDTHKQFNAQTQATKANTINGSFGGGSSGGGGGGTSFD